MKIWTHLTYVFASQLLWSESIRISHTKNPKILFQDPQTIFIITKLMCCSPREKQNKKSTYWMGLKLWDLPCSFILCKTARATKVSADKWIVCKIQYTCTANYTVSVYSTYHKTYKVFRDFTFFMSHLWSDIPRATNYVGNKSVVAALMTMSI